MSVRKILDSERWKQRRPRRLKVLTPIAPSPFLGPLTNEARTPAERARIYREPQIDYALVFRERIKQLGDDGLKEEPRLRAFEATVNLFRANHPDSDIDTAKAAVLAAIKEAAA
jgi:hypothetical protein